MSAPDRTPFPIERVRRDTPGVENVVHFNNAGSALPPESVVTTVVEHVRREADIGGYEAADEAEDRLSSVYTSLAALIGAEARQIAVIENATRAWDMAVYGYPFKPGARVITCRAEYVSNIIALLQLKQRFGIEIVLIDDDDEGQIDLSQLEAELARGATMMAMTHVPTSGGLINPAAEVGKLCTAYGVFYVLDACQSIGQVPLDVDTIGCDVLSATGRKYLRGPRGTGFLFVSDRALGVIEPPFLDLHAAKWVDDGEYVIRDDAKRFENWETNFAGKLGLGAAADYALELTVDATAPRLIALGEMLRSRLDRVAGVSVHDKGPDRGGIATFTVEGITAENVRAGLLASAVNTSVSTPGQARHDLAYRGLPTVVRASVHYYNTEAEIHRFIDVLQTSVIPRP